MLWADQEKYLSSKEALMVAKVKQRNAEQSWQAASGTGEVPTLEVRRSDLFNGIYSTEICY